MVGLVPPWHARRAAHTVIVLTLRDGVPDRVDVSELKLLAYLRKPFRPQQLQQALAAAGWTARTKAE